MRSFVWSLLFPSFLAGSALGAKVPISSLTRGSVLPGNVVPNQFIVEVESASDIPTKRDVLSREPHETLYNSMRKRGVSFAVNKEFNSPGLFVGASVTLESASDRAAVAQLPGVQAIRPVVRVPAPQPVSVHVVTGLDDPNIPDTESTHILTGVDKLHALGITGKGIKIGIIDTGIDFTNPVLGGGIGPGFKIIGGFDFVGDAFNGSNTPVPGPVPLDQCNGHGTHVAGIIGANPGNEFNISGVAFEASITAYRIFGCTGDTTDDIIIEALLRGVQDGQNILTMSLGGADGWTESSSAVVSSRIAATGKIVTIAAGNDGAKGAFYTSSPGNAIDAISVSSLDNTVIPLQNATVHGVTHDPITYFDTFPLPVNGTLPIFATSTDTTIVDDACNPLPDDTPDLSNFVVVVRRGTCTFVQKLTNIAAKGGLVTLIYDNGSGFESIDVGNFTDATLIQAADGVFLVNAFAAGQNVSISFPQSGGGFQFPDSAGGLISSFTSYGPTNDMFFKPAVAAPGGNILSTFPVPLGTFAVLSGTSMATPFIAGVSALLFGVKGTSPEVGTTARTLFESTAQLVGSSHTDGDPLQTVAQQGAGLVNAFNALTTDLIISPGEFLLNDTAHFKSLQTFTVKNTGKEIKELNVSHVPAGTMLSLVSGSDFPADGPVPLSTNAASIVAIPKTFILLPGQTQTVAVQFKQPAGVDPSVLPVFSGFIQVGNPTESVHVTYLGVAAALKNAQVVDTTNTFFGVNLPVIVDGSGNFVEGPQNFTFVGADAPNLLMRLDFGTPLLRADLVDPNIKLQTTLNQRSLLSFPQTPGGTFAQVKTIGSLFEFDFQPRNSDEDDGSDFNEFALVNEFANGTTIPNGQFKILLRALKVTGDPTNEADFESWLSPVIGIEAPSN